MKIAGKKLITVAIFIGTVNNVVKLFFSMGQNSPPLLLHHSHAPQR